MAKGLRIQGLSAGYREARVIYDLSFELEDGKSLALLLGNGGRPAVCGLAQKHFGFARPVVQRILAPARSPGCAAAGGLHFSPLRADRKSVV